MLKSNFFKINLISFSKDVEKFKGRDKLEEIVQSRLNKTLKAYIDTLEEAVLNSDKVSARTVLKAIK